MVFGIQQVLQNMFKVLLFKFIFLIFFICLFYLFVIEVYRNYFLWFGFFFCISVSFYFFCCKVIMWCIYKIIIIFVWWIYLFCDCIVIFFLIQVWLRVWFLGVFVGIRKSYILWVGQFGLRLIQEVFQEGSEMFRLNSIIIGRNLFGRLYFIGFLCLYWRVLLSFRVQCWGKVLEFFFSYCEIMMCFLDVFV